MSMLYFIDETSFEAVDTWITQQGVSSSLLALFINFSFLGKILDEHEDVILEIRMFDDDTALVRTMINVNEQESIQEYSVTIIEEYQRVCDLVAYLHLAEEEEAKETVVDLEIARWDASIQCISCPFITPGPLRDFLDTYNWQYASSDIGWIAWLKVCVRIHSNKEGIVVGEQLVLQIMSTEEMTGEDFDEEEYIIPEVNDDMKAFTRLAYVLGMEMRDIDV